MRAVEQITADYEPTDVYDTTLPGQSAAGHTYGDALSDDDRTALLEYLKGL